MPYQCLTHSFVETVPEQLESGVLYVSIEFATVIHLCCCGCGNEVVTPLSSTDWRLTFDGESVSLYPSIGNWNFSCRSHYWIRCNQIEWAREWSDRESREGRRSDRKDKQKRTENKTTETGRKTLHSRTRKIKQRSLWARIVDRIFGR